MAAAPSHGMSMNKKKVSRFKGDAELKSPIRATIVEAHNLNKKSLKFVVESIKDNYLKNVIKIVKDNIGIIINDEINGIDDVVDIVDDGADSDDSKLDKECSSPKKIDFKLIEKQISKVTDDIFIDKLYKKSIPHFERNRNNLMLKIFMLQHSHAVNSLIDEVTESDITMINDYLEDDEKLIDKYEKAEELEEQHKMEMFHQLLNRNDDDDDESINLPSFMTDLGGTSDIYSGMESNNPICDSDGDNDDDDDPPINYEEYFNRFLNNGLEDELNLDIPPDSDVEEDDDETPQDEGCQSGCDCTDTCSIKTKHTKEDLEKLKLTDIKVIAKSYDISMKRSKKSKTKAQLINEIIKNEK